MPRDKLPREYRFKQDLSRRTTAEQFCEAEVLFCVVNCSLRPGFFSIHFVLCLLLFRVEFRLCLVPLLLDRCLGILLRCLCLRQRLVPCVVYLRLRVIDHGLERFAQLLFGVVFQLVFLLVGVVLHLVFGVVDRLFASLLHIGPPHLAEGLLLLGLRL
ncbi:hypothetical protein DFH06DRAFT_1176923 [Mycena polygramma]|nr:hypothetical protein DFH06DRAFT_1176923 [Mycena polygramma]